jgi:hypothetical protein
VVAALHEPGGGQPAQAAHDRVEINPGSDRDAGRASPGPHRDRLQNPGLRRAEQIPWEHRTARSFGRLLSAELQ